MKFHVELSIIFLRAESHEAFHTWTNGAGVDDNWLVKIVRMLNNACTLESTLKMQEEEAEETWMSKDPFLEYNI